MSLRSNVIANYIGQIYVAVIGIALVPFYVKYMGAEAYGLVGFFTMLQAWFGVLDLGLTPTIARETARFKSGSMSSLEYRQLYRALNILFAAVAVIGGGFLVFFAESISHNWLQVEKLRISEVVFSVQIMAISVALRWMGGVYRGVVTGSERLVWLSAFNAVVATLRFGGVFFSMWLWGNSPTVFFSHQLAIVLVEFFGLYTFSNRLLPSVTLLNEKIGYSFEPVRSLVRFSMTIAFTSLIWIVITQSDKFILSGILSLSEYGHFTLAVVVAGGITILSSPISGAIMPRMTRLHAEGRDLELVSLYRSSTQFIVLVAGSAAITLFFFPKQVLLAWTGDLLIAEKSAPILRLYAAGNGLLAVGAFPYYLQYAKGNLKYHLLGNILMGVLLLPFLIFAAMNYGALGAGAAWIGVNLLYIFLWIGYVHSKLVPGLHKKWILRDVIAIVSPMVVSGGLISLFQSDFSDRLHISIFVLFSGFLVLSAGLIFSSSAHGFFLKARGGAR